jgi:hypothetical protein
MLCLQNKISMFLVVDFVQTGKCLLGFGQVSGVVSRFRLLYFR